MKILKEKAKDMGQIVGNIENAFNTVLERNNEV